MYEGVMKPINFSQERAMDIGLNHFKRIGSSISDHCSLQCEFQCHVNKKIF